jgi:hypothetical protein
MGAVANTAPCALLGVAEWAHFDRDIGPGLAARGITADMLDPEHGENGVNVAIHLFRTIVLGSTLKWITMPSGAGLRLSPHEAARQVGRAKHGDG